MALKNSTDRGALERLLLSRLPRKDMSMLGAELHAALPRADEPTTSCALMELPRPSFAFSTRSSPSSTTATPSRPSRRASSPPTASPTSSSRRGLPADRRQHRGPHLNDVAGVRDHLRACPSDIYHARRRLYRSQDDITRPPAQGLHRPAQAQRLPQPATSSVETPIYPARPEAHDARRGAVPHHLHGLVGKP